MRARRGQIKPFEIVRPPLEDVADGVLQGYPTQQVVFSRAEASWTKMHLDARRDPWTFFDDFRVELGESLEDVWGDRIPVEVWHLPAYQRFLERFVSSDSTSIVERRLGEITAFMAEVLPAPAE